MNFGRKIEELLVGKMLFPVTNSLYNRTGILAQFKKLLRTQFCSQEEIRALQFTRMRARLEYAARHVPYYRRIFSEIGFVPQGDFKELEDLRHIPALTRENLVEHRLDLVDERWRKAAERSDQANRPPGEPLTLALLRGKQLIRNTSSGSTGAPTVFYENGSITASNWANELRLRSWFGIPPGARESRMARVSADYIENSKNVIIRRWIWNQHLLPGISLNHSDYESCARQLSRFEPRVLWGFTSAAAGLAAYLRDNPESGPKRGPQLVITWAAPLYEHERNLLKEAFRCDVTNIYGTREIGHIGALCPHGSLHVNQESTYVESEGTWLNENEAGSAGELLATTLTPSPMPFIRYRTGDLGKIRQSRCTCGRNLAEIGEFTGRTGEILVTADGRMISPNFWCRTFMDPKLGSAIQRFQVVYRSDTSFLIRIVRGPAYHEGIENHLRSAVLRNLFGSARIDFEYLARIEAHVSGKYQMVINESTKGRPKEGINT